MATIQNARDVLLQAAGTRFTTPALVGTIDFSNVTGATKPSDNADVTTSILSSSGTSVVMSNANLFKSSSGVGGVFIGSGGLTGKDSGGSTTFSINGTTGAATFSGDITGGSNINITGNGAFGGANAAGGFSMAITGNASLLSNTGGLYARGQGTAPGVYGSSQGSFSGGGGPGGVQGATDEGIGAMGQATGGGHGVYAKSVSGKALYVDGLMYTNNSTLVSNLNAQYHGGYAVGNSSGQVPVSNGTLNTNLNAQYLGGNLASAFATAGHNHSGVYAPVSHIGTGTTQSGDHDARYPNKWPTDSGTAYAGDGMNIFCTITGYRTRGTGNVIYIEPVSDGRLKFEAEPETLGREFIRQVRPIRYRQVRGGTWRHGFLYGHMRRLLPAGDDALATVLDDGAGSVDYQSLLGPLVRSFQEQDADLQSLAQQVRQLSLDLQSLRSH
jgi:hypothetical protein